MLSRHTPITSCWFGTAFSVGMVCSCSSHELDKTFVGNWQGLIYTACPEYYEPEDIDSIYLDLNADGYIKMSKSRQGPWFTSTYSTSEDAIHVGSLLGGQEERLNIDLYDVDSMQIGTEDERCRRILSLERTVQEVLRK